MRQEWLKNKLTLDEVDKSIKKEMSTIIEDFKNPKAGLFDINGVRITDESKRDLVNEYEKHFKTYLERWTVFKTKFQDGDEIWDYIEPKERKQLPNGDWVEMSRKGFALVRNNVVLEQLIIE